MGMSKVDIGWWTPRKVVERAGWWTAGWGAEKDMVGGEETAPSDQTHRDRRLQKTEVFSQNGSDREHVISGCLGISMDQPRASRQMTCNRENVFSFLCHAWTSVGQQIR